MQKLELFQELKSELADVMRLPTGFLKNHGFVNGIEYFVLSRFGQDVIIVRCPKCGRLGRLTKSKSRYLIIHNKYGRDSHRISRTSEFWEEIDEIYNLVRSTP